MEKISKLAAGTIRVKWDVEQNVIKRMGIDGSFFAGRKLERLCRKLEGCPYEKKQVYEVLKAEEYDNVIYGVSSEELLNAMF